MFAFASQSRVRGVFPPWWFAASLRCTPLQRLRASRYSGGVAFLLHQEGWGLHPTSGYQLSAFTERCRSSPNMFCWFRANGSHLLIRLAHRLAHARLTHGYFSLLCRSCRAMYCRSAQIISPLRERPCSAASWRIRSLISSGYTNVIFFLVGGWCSMHVLYTCLTCTASGKTPG